MTDVELADAVVAALATGPDSLAEAFLKRGRTRRCEVGPQGSAVVLSEERAWAVRAGSPRASFFAAGTGRPSPAGAWPDPDGRGLRLPEPSGGTGWRAPADLDAPLLGEREALGLLERFEKALQQQVAGARLLHGQLEDGSSVAELVNSRGVRARLRRRLASLRLEVAGPGRDPVTTRLLLAEREARRFAPAALARLAGDRLVVRERGKAVERDRGDLVLAPGVAIRILEGLAPLVVGPQAPALARRYRDRRGRMGSRRLTLVDDGRLPDGLLSAPVDGEGSPTREVVLVEEGAFRQPLLAWWQVRGLRGRSSGCVGRSSWRELPRPGPTHLYLRPDPSVSAASLLASVGRGFYLLDTTGGGRFDLERDLLAVPVCGFALRRGRAEAPVARTWLCGGIGAFLQGLRATARDLTFRPLGGLIGSPTLLVSGLELRRSP